MGILKAKTLGDDMLIILSTEKIESSLCLKNVTWDIYCPEDQDECHTVIKN